MKISFNIFTPQIFQEQMYLVLGIVIIYQLILLKDKKILVFQSFFFSNNFRQIMEKLEIHLDRFLRIFINLIFFSKFLLFEKVVLELHNWQTKNH